MARRKPLLRVSMTEDQLDATDDAAGTVADLLEQFLFGTGALYCDRLDEAVRELSKLVGVGTGKELLAEYRSAWTHLYALQKKAEEIRAEVFHRSR